MNSEWRRLKIQDVADIVGGGTPRTTSSEFWNGDVPWVTPKDLSSHVDRYIKRGTRNITRCGLARSSAKLVPEYTVLLSSRAPVGYLAIADNTLATSQGCKSLVMKKGYSYLFLYYLLRTNSEYLKAYAVGSTFKEISKQILSNMEFNIPNFSTQIAVAKIFSSLDDKIELNRQMCETLESIAAALFKSWFVDFDPVKAKAQGLTPKGLSPELAALFPDSFEDSPLGPIPSGWRVGKLGNLFVFSKGKKPRVSSKKRSLGWLPHILIKSFNGCYDEYAQAENMVISDIKETIMVMYGASSGLVTIGHKGIVGSTLAKLTLRDTQFWIYLHEYLKLKQTDIGVNTFGTSIPYTDMGRVTNYSTVLPDKKIADALIHYFNEILTPIYDKYFQLVKNSWSIADLRDILLPRLLSGELCIKDV